MEQNIGSNFPFSPFWRSYPSKWDVPGSCGFWVWFIDVHLFNVEGRVTILGGHLKAPSVTSDPKSSPISTRVRPPITTHVLDVARGCPASGIEVLLEMYNSTQLSPVFGQSDNDKWTVQGSSTTDKDGRSGQLMKIVNDLNPGVYRISFNTGKYNPHGFFPFVSIVFEVKESQKNEHFHVPLLLSPFSFSTYRGS